MPSNDGGLDGDHHMLRSTRSMEAFRSSAPPIAPAQSKQTLRSEYTRTPSGLSTEVTALDFETGPGSIPAMAVVTEGEAEIIGGKPMDRRMTANVAALTKSQSEKFRSPAELGVAMPSPIAMSAAAAAMTAKHPQQQQQQQAFRQKSRRKMDSTVSDGSHQPSGDRRSSSARRGTKSAAAAAAAATNLVGTNTGSLTSNEGTVPKSPPPVPSIVCALCYRGMEVVFSTTPPRGGTKSSVVGICARTRAVFQTLDLPPGSEPVAVSGNNLTGMVLVATNGGVVHTFVPAETSPVPAEGEPVAAFGRYRWLGRRVVNCREVFRHGDQKDAEDGSGDRPIFARRAPGSDLEKCVDVSSSSDFKVLVAHRDQLAVFDAASLDEATTTTPAVPTAGREEEQAPERGNATPKLSAKSMEEDHLLSGLGLENTQKRQQAKEDEGSTGLAAAELLWTTRTHATLVTAKIAGDGRAIALVLRGEGVGVPYPYGARTYVRDRDDGSWMRPLPRPVNSMEIRRASVSSPIAPPPIPEHGGRSGDESSSTDPYDVYVSKSMSSGGGGVRQSVTGSGGSSGVGILYKPGPFLVHSTSVTRLSFRGLGHNTSRTVGDDEEEDDDEGNDLLLTCCEGDSTMRVFGQSSWNQLMHWTAPPGSRADWVRGISAFNLGDLEPSREKKSSSSSSSAPPSRRDSASDLASSSDAVGEADGGINKVLLGSKPFSALPAFPSPSSSAGAWIAELTFRNAFPALRLSRLSYMKSGGDDAHPAHFESVAAILPPGSLVPEAIMTNDDGGLSVQGIWPAWDPWGSGPGGHHEGTLSGSAMALLGLPSGGGAAGGTGFGGEQELGGTHSPPSELRLVASHPPCGKVVVMEFPLWGDKDFGAMEFGSPLRYLLSLSHEGVSREMTEALGEPDPVCNRTVCLDNESHILCAQVGPTPQSISLSWRKQGSMSILPASRRGLSPSESVTSLTSSESLSFDESDCTFDSRIAFSDGPEVYEDISVAPLPLCLPPLLLPRSTIGGKNKASPAMVSALKWWPDENFGGPPRLLAVTSTGTLVLYEMPPPWSALEPPMPSYDPFVTSAGTSLAGSVSDDAAQAVSGEDNSDYDSDEERQEYEVMITPHPDFGIGLRLEAQANGMPAIAGSYKKHPLSGGRLPAERTGMIILGDELLSVNGATLEGISFDEIIGKVRQIGAETPPGTALRMKFRPAKRRVGSVFDSAASPSGLDVSNHSAGRRTMEQILGVSPKQHRRGGSRGSSVSFGIESTEADPGGEGVAGVAPSAEGSADEEGSHATMLIGADAETQQEFGRIIAIVRDALPGMKSGMTTEEAACDTQSLVVLLPWNYGRGAPVAYQSRGAVLLVSSSEKTLTASRLEVTNDGDPENTKFFELGSVELKGDEKAQEKKKGCGSSSGNCIRSLTVVKVAVEGWCLAACDERGGVTLVFIDVKEKEDPTRTNVSKKGDNVSAVARVGAFPSSATLNATFRQIPIFRCHDECPSPSSCGDYLVRAASVELLATMPKCRGKCRTVTVWSSRPLSSFLPADSEEKVAEGERPLPPDYDNSTVCIAADDVIDGDDSILDFRFVASGSVDAFPWLVVFTTNRAVVYRRSGGQLHWQEIASLKYPSLSGSSLSSQSADRHMKRRQRYEGTMSPADACPHLIPALRNIVAASDERNLIRSDWHPDSILAYICTEKNGVRTALHRNVRGIYNWLSRWMNPDEAARPAWNTEFPLGIAPLRVVQDESDPADDDGNDDNDNVESAISLMASLTMSRTNARVTPEDELLLQLQAALCPGREVSKEENKTKEPELSKPERSEEFLLAMAHANKPEPASELSNRSKSVFPAPLEKLNRDELRFLWAMGELIKKPPEFKKLDPPGQLGLFCVSLVRHIKVAKNDDEKEETRNAKSSSPTLLSNTPETTRPFLVKRSSLRSMDSDKPKQPPTMASGGCLSALLSNTQRELLSACRIPQEKMDWPTARELALPFWLRSNDELRNVSEEIAQAIYKKTKDVMECALFYTAVRNMRTLRNIAATDQSTSGRMFLKFIIDNDFSSQRGRRAAEKNAYSLLRKRRYVVAAAFFLLPEPPMLKSALEIIATQMEDLSLAFLVARMVESRPSPSSGGVGGGLTIGGAGMGLGMMGGGGGFASGGGMPVPSTSASNEEIKYEDWKPKLGEGTRKLLTSRGLPMAKDDPCFQALQLVWLDRAGDAARCLSGCSSGNGTRLSIKCDLVVPARFDVQTLSGNASKGTATLDRGGAIGSVRTRNIPTSGDPSRDSANDRVISKSNALINFSSCPFLLKRMKAARRCQWASALLVSRALSRRGIELPSMQALLQNTDPHDLSEEKKDDGARKEPTKCKGEAGLSDGISVTVNASPQKPMGTASSIFDSFDAPSQTSKTKANGEMSSSIFDSFDGPATTSKLSTNSTLQSGDMNSSIFNSFDAPTTKAKPAAKQPSASGGMTSSIFDSFDAAPPQKLKPASAHSGGMGSSIFDSFDPAPQKPKAAVVPSSGKMESSIFDSFDAAPQQPKTQVSAAHASGEMTSSIFDSFDAAPARPKPKPATKVASAAGDMSSSIFDSFDAPRPTAQKVVTTSTSASSAGGPPASEENRADGKEESAPPLPVPPLWVEWRENLLALAVARRLLREMARSVARFHGDALSPPLKRFRRHMHPIVFPGAPQVLQKHCEGETLLDSVRTSLKYLCAKCKLEEAAVVEQALLLLASATRPRRIVFAVLLHCLMDRADLAEDVVREAAHGQLHRCEAFALSTDDLVYNCKTRFHAASQFVRREASCVSWQLELCLWLNRGGTFPMTGIALKETVVAVRVGLLVASWGRCHESLETMIRCEPDVAMDHEAGRQLWSSMKMIASFEDRSKKNVSASSGGWEFLVDCRRSEATDMLRDRKPGSFLLRPHAEDHGVFTLSFKTNLVPTGDAKNESDSAGVGSNTKADGQMSSKSEGKENASEVSHPPSNARPVKRDEVVQHAIIRLSDSGFRCGSFGPFTTLLKLLEAVSTSLPFDLLFDEPPVQGIIKDQGSQPSPNAFFLRKLSLHSKSDRYRWNSKTREAENPDDEEAEEIHDLDASLDEEGTGDAGGENGEKEKAEFALQKRFGMFSQLLAMNEIRKQLSAVAAADYEEPPVAESAWQNGESHVASADEGKTSSEDGADEEFDGSFSESTEVMGVEELYSVAARVLRPLLCWCRTMEIAIVHEMAPDLRHIAQTTASLPVAVAASETAIEAAPFDVGSCIDGGDAVIRRMIQRGSGVEFRTLRVGEGGHSAIIVLFSKNEAIPWLISSGAEKDEVDAAARLQMMEKRRVIEQIDLNRLSVPKAAFTLAGGGADNSLEEIRFRFVDPWEVEAVETKEGEIMGASLGREHYLSFNVGLVARSCEKIERSLGGLHLLGLWSIAKGGIGLTKALASVHPPWERDEGGDLLMKGESVAAPSAYINSIRQHLYRNALFRRLKLPNRFLALIQVELLDLKNLTSPGGSSTITAYALLRLKRPGSGAPLTHKARTLDSAATQPKKIGKSSGPNAPASWGSLVRFRFPLPEDVDCDGQSSDRDREALFKGPPSVLQMSVYEKKFMNDIQLGRADVKLDAVASGGQLEEWVPLRVGNVGISWFARIRLTLRFELMCLETDEAKADHGVDSVRSPSVGLKKIQQLSSVGGAHEDVKMKGFKRSNSTPDLLGYFESMVY